jgi:hypothetical protein
MVQNRKPDSPVFPDLPNLVINNNLVLPRPFYLNDVMLAPNLVQSLISVSHFTTDNFCSMEFDLFGLSVKDLAIRRVLVRYDSTIKIRQPRYDLIMLSCVEQAALIYIYSGQ